ncbi:MAG: DNA cytosine methyltransferase [Solirubrobacterales bacterium]
MTDQLGFAEEVRDYVRLTMGEIEARKWNGLTCVGSFSGCGGSSLGLRMAGWKVPYAIEFIPEAKATYEANSPSTYVDGRDIRQIQPQEILDRLGLEPGELDLYEGSPPCSSFSAAGKREKGWGQEKSYSDAAQRTDDLFDEWLRILEGLRPKAIIAENVPGMMMGRALEEYMWAVMARLRDLGYRASAKVLDSCWYGVPQLRKRLIFMGVHEDYARVAPAFPPPTTDPPFTLGQALHAAEHYREPGEVDEVSMERFAIGRSWRAITQARSEGREVDFRYLPCQRCGKSLHVDHEILKTSGEGVVTKATCADGEPADISKEYFMLVIPELDRPCPTVTATAAQVGAASVCHPNECRKFTAAELRSICGFPADFILTGTPQQQRERMGRAVTPPMYEACGRVLAEALR